MAKHKEVYRVELKEFKNGLRLPLIKKDFNTLPEAEAYYDELLLDNERGGIVLGKLVELQYFDINQRCSTLREKHV